MENNISRDDLNAISMQVILHAGNARDLVMQVMNKLAETPLQIDQIHQLLKKAHSELTEAHNHQTDMIQKEANGELIPYSVLFIHSQDTLMTIQSELIMVERLVPIVNRLDGETNG